MCVFALSGLISIGQTIGYVGSTGRATGPHLHYTLIHGGRPIDPLRFESPPAEPLPPELRPWLDEARQKWVPVLASVDAVDDAHDASIAADSRGDAGTS